TEPLMPLDKGAPNTVTLSNGEVVYKLDGEWSCVMKISMRDLMGEDIIKISQDGNTFVGIYINGHRYMSAGDWAIKGELEKNGFKSVYVNTTSFQTAKWIPATAKISENCNKIVYKAKVQGLGLEITTTRK
ncbi:MAG: hypothetical protein ACR2PH_09500, partial [Desulfobulbia bacterium]